MDAGGIGTFGLQEIVIMWICVQNFVCKERMWYIMRMGILDKKGCGNEEVSFGYDGDVVSRIGVFV